MMANYLKKMYLLALLLVLTPHISYSERRIDPVIQQRIDDFVTNEYFARAKISSLGLTIVQNDGEVLYSTGYGLADAERQIPVENSTQFCVGSITKGFTSVLVAKILNEKFPDLGAAVLDTPIRKLMPEVNFTLSDRFRSEHTTFRDLVAHRSCLYQGNLPIFSGSLHTSEDITYAARYEEELCGFRTEYHYNNRMYAIAGELIGILAGSTYDDLVQDLLNELGMTESAPGKQTDDYSQMPFRAMPYYMRDSVAQPYNTDLTKRISIVNAPGGLFFTPNDMVKYMRFHLNLGNLDGKQIVPKEVMEWVRSPSITVPRFTFKERNEDKIINVFGYGLGLNLGSYDGWEFIHHAGYYPPYTSLMSLFPAKNLAIFATTNQGTAPVGADQPLLHAVIFEILNGNTEPAEKIEKIKSQLDKEMEMKRENVENDFQKIVEKMRKMKGTQRQEEIIGKYGSGSLGEAEVTQRFNTERNRTEYYFQHGIWYEGWMEEMEEGVHYYRFHFETDAIQDDYAAGLFESYRFIYVMDGTLYLVQLGTGEDATSKFKLGLRMDQLPHIPWSPDSCGPEAN